MPVATTGDLPLGKKQVADRYNRSKRCIDRWKKDPRVAFPKADFTVMDSEFWYPKTIETWESTKAEASILPANSDASD